MEGFTEKEYEMVRLENVGDVLFQALMLDDVKIKDGMMYADFLSVILDNIVIIIKKLCVTKGREKIWVNQNVFIVELPKICLIQILYQMH